MAKCTKDGHQVSDADDTVPCDVCHTIGGATKFAEQNQDVTDHHKQVVIQVGSAAPSGIQFPTGGTGIPAIKGRVDGAEFLIDRYPVVGPFVAGVEVAGRSKCGLGDQPAPSVDGELIFMLTERQVEGDRPNPVPVVVRHSGAVPAPGIEAAVEVDHVRWGQVQGRSVHAEVHRSGRLVCGVGRDAQLQFAVHHLDVLCPEGAKRAHLAVLGLVPPRGIQSVKGVVPSECEVVGGSCVARSRRVVVVANVVVPRSPRHGRGIPHPRPIDVFDRPEVHEDAHGVDELGHVFVREGQLEFAVDEPPHGRRFPFDGVIDHRGVGVERRGQNLGHTRQVRMVGGELHGVV